MDDARQVEFADNDALIAWCASAGVPVEALSVGPDQVEWRDEDGLTALHLAAAQGKLNVLQWFHRRWPDYIKDPVDYNHPGVFVLAAAAGSIETLNWLTGECGLDPTKQTCRLGSPTSLAASRNQKETIKWLFENGCCLESDEHSTMLNTIKSGHCELVKWLYDEFDEYSQCQSVLDAKWLIFARTAATKGSLPILQFLFEHGTMFLVKDVREVFKVAITSDCGEIVAWMLETRWRRFDPGKFLDLAVQSKSMKSVQHLIMYLGPRHWRILLCVKVSAALGELDILKCLKAYGVDVVASNGSSNRNALMSAAENGRLACVKWLLKQGCQLSARSCGGSTALSLAIREGKHNVVAFLQSLMNVD
jgi:hypothetical protein